MPGRPRKWSAWKWVMKTVSRSISPTERTSWRWVPSPQSKSRRSPPRRTSVAGSPRRAVGAEPAVPTKRTSRSIARLSWRFFEPDQLEGDPPVLDPGHAHRVDRLAAAVGRAAGVEDLEVALVLVEGDVGVAEDHGVRAGE